MTGDEETVKTFMFKGIGELFRFQTSKTSGYLRNKYATKTTRWEKKTSLKIRLILKSCKNDLKSNSDGHNILI